MNERDYHIAEITCLVSGIMILITFNLTYYLSGSMSLIPSIIINAFIMFTSFTLGLYLHLKRRIYILEMTEGGGSSQKNGQ